MKIILEVTTEPQSFEDEIGNLLQDSIIREDIEWEVSNVLTNWIQRDRNRFRIKVRVVEDK